MTTVAVVYAVIPAAPVSCDTRGSSSGSRGTLRANAESSPSSVTRRVSATVSEYGATPLRTRTVSSTSAALTPSRILAYGRLRVPKRGPATVVLSTTTRVGFTTTSVTVSATPPARPITNALPNPTPVTTPLGETVTAAALPDDQRHVARPLGRARGQGVAPGVEHHDGYGERVPETRQGVAHAGDVEEHGGVGHRDEAGVGHGSRRRNDARRARTHGDGEWPGGSVEPHDRRVRCAPRKRRVLDHVAATVPHRDRETERVLEARERCGLGLHDDRGRKIADGDGGRISRGVDHRHDAPNASAHARGQARPVHRYDGRIEGRPAGSLVRRHDQEAEAVERARREGLLVAQRGDGRNRVGRDH